MRGILQVPGSKARRAGTASRGGVREGRGGGSRMNASPRGKTHQRPEAGRLRVLRVLANGAEGARVRGQASHPSQDCLLGTPSESVRRASPRPLQRAPLRPSSPPANHHPQPEHYLPWARRPRVHLVPLPHPGVAGRRPGGARAAARGREASERARARRHLPSLGLPDGGV